MEEGVRDIMQSVRDGLAGETRLSERLLSLVRSHLKTLLGPRFDALAQRACTRCCLLVWPHRGVGCD
jgi:hypothetical protein